MWSSQQMPKKHQAKLICDKKKLPENQEYKEHSQFNNKHLKTLRANIILNSDILNTMSTRQ